MKNEMLFDQPDRRAKPQEMAASPDLVMAMTSSNSRNGIAGTADRLPPVYRAGSMDHEQAPSRVGKRLNYRDGTVKEIAR